MRFGVDEAGWLRGARHVASQNCDPRPVQARVEVLIIHSISLPSGMYGGLDVERLFTNRLETESRSNYADLKGLKVSAHLFIRRDGEVIQFVSFEARAWHAGVSSCEGRERVNDFSVGIELEGTDQTPFEDTQYASLIEVSRALLVRYPMVTADRFYGHSDIAPGRKSDPGPYFDWNRYRTAMRGISPGSMVGEARQ